MTLPYNRVQFPSNFTWVHMEWMTRGISFIYTASRCQSAPRAGRQAGVLSGCKKVQHGLTAVECHSRLLVWFFFSFLLPWTQSSFNMSNLVSFRIVQGAWYHLRASTLTGVDTLTCPRKVKKRHTNTYWSYPYCYLFHPSLYCGSWPQLRSPWHCIDMSVPFRCAFFIVLW